MEPTLLITAEEQMFDFLNYLQSQTDNQKIKWIPSFSEPGDIIQRKVSFKTILGEYEVALKIILDKNPDYRYGYYYFLTILKIKEQFYVLCKNFIEWKPDNPLRLKDWREENEDKNIEEYEEYRKNELKKIEIETLESSKDVNIIKNIYDKIWQKCFAKEMSTDYIFSNKKTSLKF